MIWVLVILVWGLAIFQLGLTIRQHRLLTSLQEWADTNKNKPKTIPRPAASHSSIPSYQGMKQGRAAHVVNPKTPQELEREVDERLRKRSLVEQSIQGQR